MAKQDMGKACHKITKTQAKVKEIDMPRGPRLDAPGALHPLIIRGIEKGNSVNEDKDRENFVSRMGYRPNWVAISDNSEMA